MSKISTVYGSRSPVRGFTLIELLVVLAIIAVLLSIAAPRYFGGIDRSKEAVLKEDLFLMREAIDQYRADKGRYPATLQELVQGRYLRKVPTDPITETDSSWVTLAADGDPVSGSVFDVRSGAPGTARDGRPYAEW